MSKRSDNRSEKLKETADKAALPTKNGDKSPDEISLNEVDMFTVAASQMARFTNAVRPYAVEPPRYRNTDEIDDPGNFDLSAIVLQDNIPGRKITDVVMVTDIYASQTVRVIWNSFWAYETRDMQLVKRLIERDIAERKGVSREVIGFLQSGEIKYSMLASWAYDVLKKFQSGYYDPRNNYTYQWRTEWRTEDRYVFVGVDPAKQETTTQPTPPPPPAAPKLLTPFTNIDLD